MDKLYVNVFQTALKGVLTVMYIILTLVVQWAQSMSIVGLIGSVKRVEIMPLVCVPNKLASLALRAMSIGLTLVG